jgi:hypothetical protein
METSLSIKNLVPALLEFGKIKIGNKGKLIRDQFRMPQKLDHFLITTTEKDDQDNFILDDELMGKVKVYNKTEKITSIPIVLLYNDIDMNFISRYVCYRGATRWCSGDGVTAFWVGAKNVLEQRECPCERCASDYPGEDGKGKGKCKASGCLSVLIQGAEVVGGVWKYRTTGYNSVRAITASLLLIKNQTGGLLAGLPLEMIVRPKKTTSPTDGKPVTIYIVTLIYRGSPATLREVAYQIATEDTKHRLKLGDVEQEVRKMLTTSVDEEIVGGDEVEHAEEFYPEDVIQETDKNEIREPEPELPKRTRSKKKTAAVNLDPVIEPPVEEIIVEDETVQADNVIEPPVGEDEDFDLFGD